MKLSAAAIAVFAPLATGFVVVPSSQSVRCTSLSASIVTGPEGKAAASAEEDLMLTLKIIMDHAARSTTVSKDQYISQMKEIQNLPEETAAVDISIPYDAPAKLAYESSDKSMAYADFKTKYEAEAVADVIAKRQSSAAPAAPAPAPPAASAPVTAAAEVVAPVEVAPVEVDVDLSIPYDAAAKLAYEASDKSLAYADFKPKYEADAVADVVSKRPVDLSIPYDAPARLAFLKSERSTPYADFKAKYEADAVAEVVAKRASKSE